MWLTTSVTNHFFYFPIGFQFCLNCVPHWAAHDRFMIPCLVIALKRYVRIRSFCDQILWMCFLQELITFIGLIPQNIKDTASAERSTIPGKYSDFSQLPDNLL